MARPPGSQNKDKPYRDALRVEAALAENGEESPALPGSLRWIARNLLMRAGEETNAAKEVGDRLDGKPAQESTVTTIKHDVTDWSRAELVAVLNDARSSGGGAAKANGRGNGSDPLH